MVSENNNIELVNPLTRLEWLENRQILAIKNEDNTRDGIDRITTRLAEVAQELTGKRVFILVDATHDVAMTPYARAKLKETFDHFKNHEGRTAMVIQTSVFGHIVRLFMRGQKVGKRERRLFFNREEALAWLKVGITQD